MPSRPSGTGAANLIVTVAMPPADPGNPDAIAMLQLSGGTTGTPKAIPRLHAEYWYYGRATGERFGFGPGDRVRVRRVEGGILLEPIVTDVDAWFHEMDRFSDVPFMEDGRRQPPMPEFTSLLRL